MFFLLTIKFLACAYSGSPGGKIHAYDRTVTTTSSDVALAPIDQSGEDGITTSTSDLYASPYIDDKDACYPGLGV
ncbi:hypothetical protein MRX96_051383 [Rhipicephalus microplus]